MAGTGEIYIHKSLSEDKTKEEEVKQKDAKIAESEDIKVSDQETK